MKTLLAYHNDPAVKTKFVNRLAEHRRLEHLVQGTGWTHKGTTKGCAVGCTLENYDHALYPIELGLPEWLARLEDSLFENLPKGEAEQFAEDFLRVIPVGANVEPVRHQLAIIRQEASLQRLQDNKEPYADECRKAIGLVIAFHQSQLNGEINNEAAESAAASAWSAARSASTAAAESAESAARSAAWSASTATWSAAESAAASAWSADVVYYKWEAEILLSLLAKA